jgi:gluconolactonase
MEMDVEAVYYISPGGELTRVIDDLEKPNGLILSQDEQTLYVVDNGAENVWAYDVAGPGELENGRVFSDMSSGPRSGGGDGMTLDRQGNVYVAGSKDVWVWTPEGDLIQRIAVPEGPSNCTFGGPDRGTLYITARSSLYRIDTKVQGAR